MGAWITEFLTSAGDVVSKLVPTITKGALDFFDGMFLVRATAADGAIGAVTGMTPLGGLIAIGFGCMLVCFGIRFVSKLIGSIRARARV